MLEWIKVTDRLPEEGQSVLVYEKIESLIPDKSPNPSHFMEVAHYRLGEDKKEYWIGLSDRYDPEPHYWMPLPEPPVDL